MVETKAVPIQQFKNFLQQPQFPCVAAKAAQARQNVNCMMADHLACTKDDEKILKFFLCIFFNRKFH